MRIKGISWRNGSAPDSRSGGCVFKSRRDHNFRIFKELIKHNFIGSTRISNHIQFPYCLVVRIPGSHPGGPGSIPGMGKMSS